jgi:hypothetical protein
VTVYDFDQRQKTCPVCEQKRLIFIVTAPNLWPVGDTVRHRCKACATAEAEAGGDPLTVFHHGERRGLSAAWERDRRGEMPERLKVARQKAQEARHGSILTLPGKKWG